MNGCCKFASFHVSRIRHWSKNNLLTHLLNWMSWLRSQIVYELIFSNLQNPLGTEIKPTNRESVLAYAAGKIKLPIYFDRCLTSILSSCCMLLSALCVQYCELRKVKYSILLNLLNSIPQKVNEVKDIGRVGTASRVYENKFINTLSSSRSSGLSSPGVTAINISDMTCMFPWTTSSWDLNFASFSGVNDLVPLVWRAAGGWVCTAWRDWATTGATGAVAFKDRKQITQQDSVKQPTTAVKYR